MSLLFFILLGSLLVFAVRELSKPRSENKAPSVPTVRFSIFIPNCLNRLIFFVVGPRLIRQGYSQYKDTPYRVLKSDGDLIVLPRRYLAELRHLPPSELSSLDAQFENVLGEYTKVTVESHLPSSTVSKRLIPRLVSLVPRILCELNDAFGTEIPECDGKIKVWARYYANIEGRWVSINAYNMMLRLLTRATSRLIAGEDAAMDKNLPDLVSGYTVNMGITIVILRPFPQFLRPLVAKLLPSVRKLEKLMKRAKEDVFLPVIRARLDAVETLDPSYKKPDDFLQWMLDLSDNPRDREPAYLAHNLFIIMSLAAIHTSAMALTQTLYDLILHSTYVNILRTEIRASLATGWENGTLRDFLAMRRLDSFMRESQRFNPASEVSFHRIVKIPLTLSDGFYLPAGTHICFPSAPMSHDPSIITSPDPKLFDPLRWSDGPSRKSMIAIVPDNMHFGYGRQACPGRPFAAAMMKMVLSRLLLDYEIRFEGRGVMSTTRPKNVVNGEQILPNLTATVSLRRAVGRHSRR